MPRSLHNLAVREVKIHSQNLRHYQGNRTRNPIVQPLRDLIPPGSFPAVLSRGTSAILAFASTIVLARLLGPDGYGSYTFAVAFLGLASLIGIIGLDQLTVRELGVAFHEHRMGLARGFLRWSNAVAGTTSILLFVLAQGLLAWNPLEWVPDHVQTARILLLALPVVTFVRLSRGRLQAIDRAPLGIFLELTLWNILLLAGAGLLWFLGRSMPVDAAWIHVAAITSVLLAAFFAFQRLAPSHDEPAKIHDGWAKMGVHFAFFALAGFLLMQADVLLVGTIATPEETGAFGVAVRCAGLTLLVLQPLQQILAPRIARAWRRQDADGAASIARKCARLSLLGTAPFLLVYGFVPDLFLRLFGTGFEQAAWSLRFLMLSQVALVLFGPIQMALAMTHKEQWATGLTVAGLVVSLPLAYFLYAPFGITGVAAARIVSVSVIAVGGYMVLRRSGLDPAPWARA